MSRSVLRQFLLATALIVLYVLVGQYHYMTAHPQFAERAGGMAQAFLVNIPHAILFALPIAVGVSLSLLPNAPGAFRQGMLVAGSVTAFLVVNDLAGRGFWDAIERRQFGAADFEARPRRFNDTTSALGGALAHALGRVRPEDLQPWPPHESTDTTAFRPIRDAATIVRLSAVMKYQQVLEMLIPMLVAGVIVGLGIWLRRIATFRTPRDERLLRLGLGWLLSLVLGFGLAMSGGGLYTLSSPRSSMLWMLVPYIVVGVPAFMGWRAARRLDTLAAE